MDLFSVLTIIFVLASVFGYINVRFFKMPSTIWLMIMSLVVSMVLIFIDWDTNFRQSFLSELDFKTVLLDVMLSFLLFAGALHTDINKLKQQIAPILSFATFGVLLSTALIGLLAYWAAPFLGLEIDLIYCLLFGALISPTDPIAVLGILKEAKAPKKLEIKIVGESLFNDGIGVVVFLTLLGIAVNGPESAGLASISILFVQEVFGGLALGALFGYFVFLMMRQIDHYETEVMLSLSLVMAISVVAHLVHVSAPLAVVVAGLIVGNRARHQALSETTERYIDKFWEIIDVLLNAILFVLMGFELVFVSFDSNYLMAGFLAIPLTLLVRWVVIAIPIRFFNKKLNFVPKTTTIMTWGGLRGGISIALALSLPPGQYQDLILTATYMVVAFSIIVQGLSLKALIKKLGVSEN